MVNIDYLYNPEAAKPKFDKNYFVDKKLGFQVIEHGTVLPHVGGGGLENLGGVVNSKGEFVKNTSVTSWVGGVYTPPPESIQHSSKTVIYLGMFYNIWGHIITDNVRRLWFLQSNDYKSLFKDCTIIYIPWSFRRKESEANFKQLLKILDIDLDDWQPITQPTRFDEIILPDGSFRAHHYFTNEYCETMERVRNFAYKNRTPTSSKKLYFYHGLTQFGEKRLAEYFKSKGYEIIQPEKLPLDEQLNRLINCESFASTVGSCAHNSVFLHPGTEVILIPRYGNGFTGYQQVIDQANSLNANYIDTSMSIFKLSNHNYCYLISKQLKEFFGDKWNGYEKEDFKIFLQYVKDCINKSLVANLEVIKNYGSVFTDFMAQLKQREDLIKAYDMPPHWEEFQPWLSYQTHVSKKGWGVWNTENQISNELDKQLHIEAIKVNYPGHKIYYSVYFSDEEGWSLEVTNGLQAGTTGKVKPIMGMRARFDEAGAKEFDILYRMHKFDGTWTPWATNGEALYSFGQRLNAIQIKLEPVNTQSDETKTKETPNKVQPDKVNLK